MAYLFTAGNSASLERNATGTFANSGLTIALWYKSIDTNGKIITFAMSGSGGNQATSLEFGGTTGGFGRLDFRVDRTTTDSLWNTPGVGGIVTAGSIDHVSVSYDGASTANTPVLVANGSSYTLSNKQQGVGPMDMTYDDVVIGNVMQLTATPSATFFEMVVYNTNLTLQEQMTLYSPVKYLPLQVRPNNIFAYWPMDDFPNNATPSGANTIRDASSSKFHMTPVNTLTAKGNQIITNP